MTRNTTFGELAIGDTFEWRDTKAIQSGPPGPEPMVKGTATGYYCGPGFTPFALTVALGEPEMTEHGVLTYGAERVTAGVWAITPSLNVVGVIHGFVVIHGVPDPAPWERLIVLP
jgi:hypothetical protein